MRDERIVELVGVARIGPRFTPHASDGGSVECAVVAFL